jgi:hypothetical protein
MLIVATEVIVGIRSGSFYLIQHDTDYSSTDVQQQLTSADDDLRFLAVTD